MKCKWSWLGLVTALSLFGPAGCRHCCRRDCPQDSCCAARPPVAVGQPHPLTPLGSVPVQDPVYATPPRVPGNIPPPPPDNRYYGPASPPPPDNKTWTPAPGG